jgi:hypothetical protein
MLTEKEQAALEQFEAERERRIDEKVEKGIAIRVPPAVAVVGVPEGATAAAESARAAKLAELKAAGETREIYFEDDIAVIITGVPRAGRDPEDAVERLIERAKQSGHPTDPIQAQAAKARETPVPSRPEPEPEPEPKRVRVTIDLPTDTSLGAVVDGFYFVQDEMVYVSDALKRPLGRLALNPGDNPEIVARRLLKSKHCGNNNFYRKLQYPPKSIH